MNVIQSDATSWLLFLLLLLLVILMMIVVVNVVLLVVLRCQQGIDVLVADTGCRGGTE